MTGTVTHIVGSGHASLFGIIVVAAAPSWLLGIGSCAYGYQAAPEAGSAQLNSGKLEIRYESETELAELVETLERASE
jgi:hypothetical protein